MKPILDKWQVFFNLSKDITRIERGWYYLGFGIVKVIHLPLAGVVIQKEDYKGLLIRFYVWFPFERV